MLQEKFQFSSSCIDVPIFVSAQVNHNLPRTFGDGIIHESHIDAMVDQTLPLPELKKSGLTEEEVKIGKLIAENLVDDGATLQMGENY